MKFVIRAFSEFLFCLLFEHFPNFNEICYSSIFRFFMKFFIRAFSKFSWNVLFEHFPKLNKKMGSQFHQNITRITGTLHEDLRTCMIIYRWILLIIRNISDKIIEKIKTHFNINNFLLRKSFRLWDNVETYCREGQSKDDTI
jgi:hypothetical protein